MQMISQISKFLVVGGTALALSGCASFDLFGGSKRPEPLPPVKVITETVKAEIYQPPLPQEIAMTDVQFIVITKDNLNEKVAEVERLLGGDFVVVAMTPKGYENMAGNLQELRRYIRQQKEIILYYREVTKTGDDADREDWIERNKEKQNTQPQTGNQ
jgi:hypothetical protein